MPNLTQPPQPRPSAATFGEIDKSASRFDATKPDYSGIADSPEFRELRTRFRRFTFPMSVLFLVWYLSYVIIAAYLPEFMSIQLVGAVNVGLLMGVGQFVTTILITVLYLRYADRQIDPRVRELYREVTGEDPR